MKKEIRGKRVILREQREEDAPFFAYWFNQPRIMFQCGFEKPTDEEEMKTDAPALVIVCDLAPVPLMYYLSYPL